MSEFQSDDQVDILFIGDHAGLNEMAFRSPFLGPDGQNLKSIVKATLPETSVGYTYLLRGWPVDWDTVPEKYRGMSLTTVHHSRLEREVRTKSMNTHPERHSAVQNCLPFLHADIERFRPKMLVAMGNTVLEALFPRETRTITRLSDTTLQYRGIPIRFLSSPSVVVRNPSSRPGWENQLKAILTGKKAERDMTLGDSHLITSLSEAIDYLEMLKHTANDVAVDTETLNLHKRYGNKLATIQFAESDNGAVVLPYLHPESPFSPDEIETLNKHLYSLFNEPSEILHWVCHNAKFESHIFKNSFGTPILSAPIYDTQAGAFLLDENRSFRAAEFQYGIYSLKQLALDYLNFDGYDQGILKHREEGSLFDLDLKSLAVYGAMDAYITRRLMKAQFEEAERQDYTSQLKNLMYSLYTPMISMFVDIEQNGSPVNLPHLRTLISKNSPLLTRIEAINGELKRNDKVTKTNGLLLAGDRTVANGRVQPLGYSPWIFDFAKKGHPQALFFNVLGLEPLSTGKSGVPSVDADWQEANEKVPLVALYSEWQLMRKMYDSFAKQLYEYVDPSGNYVDCKTDCRVRPSYLISSVVTGRVACRDPNLQAIPRAENEAKKAIKNIFQALPGHVMVQLDFKANEMRWVGILAQDDKMAESFIKGKSFLDDYRKAPTPEKLRMAELYGDIHKQNASKAFKKGIETITKIERQKAKAISFGILYDSSYWAIAEQTGQSVEEVQEMFNNFFLEYDDIYLWKRDMKEMARRKGYVETPHGRRRRFPIFDFYRNPSGLFIRGAVQNEQTGAIAEAERQASNAPVQGIASDAAMIGSSLFVKYIRDHKKKWLVQNAVHDSCVFQVPYEELDEALVQSEKSFGTDLMEYMGDAFGINFLLPLETEFEIGLKWGELTKWNFSPEELVEIKKEIQEEWAKH